MNDENVKDILTVQKEQLNRSIRNALIVGIVYLGFTLLGAFSNTLMWVDVVISSVLIGGIYKRNKFCGIGMVLYTLFNIVYKFIISIQLNEGRYVIGIVLNLVFLYFFIQGMRAIISYHSLSNSSKDLPSEDEEICPKEVKIEVWTMNLERSKRAIKIAWIMAIISALLTLIGTLLSFSNFNYWKMSAWYFIDVFVILLLAYGIFKKSRICASIMFIYFVASKVMLYNKLNDISQITFGFIYCYFYFQGMVATLAYHKIQKLKLEMKNGSTIQHIAKKTYYSSIPSAFKTAVISILGVLLTFFAIFYSKEWSRNNRINFLGSGITSNDSNINEESDMNEMDIFSAAIFGRVDEIESILAEKPELVNARNENGYTPLHFAITFLGNEKAVKLLIDNGADVNARDNIGVTPLHLAVDKGPKEIVEFLISRGADINARDTMGGTALHHLAQTGQKDNTDKIEFLLSKGADINAKDNAVGGTPLHYASMNGYINMVRFLIDKGADVTCQGKDGVTALSLAEHEGHKDIANLLRKHMKDVINLLSSIEETGYKDKKVLVLTERLKKNAPEINKKLGDELKQYYKFDWYSAVMLSLKMAEQEFRALNMINDADKANKAVESLEAAWIENDLHGILCADFYNKELETVLNNITENMTEEEQHKLTVDIVPVKVLAQKLREQGDPNN